MAGDRPEQSPERAAEGEAGGTAEKLSPDLHGAHLNMCAAAPLPAAAPQGHAEGSGDRHWNPGAKLWNRNAKPCTKRPSWQESAMTEGSGWQFWIDRGGTFTDVVARRPDGAC